MAPGGVQRGGPVGDAVPGLCEGGHDGPPPGPGPPHQHRGGHGVRHSAARRGGVRGMAPGALVFMVVCVCIFRGPFVHMHNRKKMKLS